MVPTPVVPTIDLRTAPVEEIAEALMASSCAFVTGHGVPEARRTDLMEVSREFFDLPLDEKARVQWPGDGRWRGWQPLIDSKVDRRQAAKPDLLERYEFQLGPGPDGTDEGLLRRSADFGLWPDRPAGFRLAWARYYSALAGLASRVVSSIAATLDLPSDQLRDWCEDQYANLVVNNYLPQVEAPAPGQLRQRAHTDIGGLTVLWADDAPGGLEVRMPGVPGWTAVQFPPDVYLIQAGDLLARWTNQRIRANIHRVTNPPAASPTRRMSIVYFHYPRLDTVVTPAPSCVTAARPAAEPIAAGAHLLDAVANPDDRYLYRELDDALIDG
jgi:isopenicillin N synthase-like dioxygenase